MYSVEHAKNPQLKILVANRLFVDLSLVIVANKEYLSHEICDLVPVDEDSASSLKTVKICEAIKELVPI